MYSCEWGPDEGVKHKGAPRDVGGVMEGGQVLGEEDMMRRRGCGRGARGRC